MMSGIRGKDTKPEMLVRSILHRSGFRFRLHRKNLPGKPDIVLPKFGAVIFVHGCFWHMHCCDDFKWPKNRADFWKEKLSGNYERDRKNITALLAINWRVAVLWECALKETKREKYFENINLLLSWVKSNGKYIEIPGRIS
jgi:DNA mismatch endonuclease (patch repair protein)